MISDTDLNLLLEESARLNLVHTVTDIMFVRDHRDGLGERSLGRRCLSWLAQTRPIVFMDILEFIPKYGRWDDFFYINSPQLKPILYQYISSQLHMDQYDMIKGNTISQCAKWVPSEGKSFAKHHPQDFNLFLQVLGMSRSRYRRFIAGLRRHLCLLETRLCNKQPVVYDDVPKTALSLYSKLFHTTDGENFTLWLKSHSSRLCTRHPTPTRKRSYKKVIKAILKHER
jgi:hypothetical protein